MHTTKEKLNDEICILIKKDSVLSRKIADILGISDNSVYRHAHRNAPTLSKPFIVDIIKKHTGKTESEILNKEIYHDKVT